MTRRSSMFFFFALAFTMIVIGVFSAKLVFSYLFSSSRPYNPLSDDKSDPFKRTAFSFKRDIFNSFNSNCTYVSAPEVENSLRELFRESFKNKLRYKCKTTVEASLKLPKGLTYAQTEEIEKLVVKFELARSQNEKQKILKAIKRIAGPRFGVSVSVRHHVDLPVN